MKNHLIILFSLMSVLGFSQNQINVDIVTLKQLDNKDIAMYIHTRPDSLANKGIQVEINIFESNSEIKLGTKHRNRYKDSIDKTTGDYDHFDLKTESGIITTQTSPITSKYYRLEVILYFLDGTKKTESKILKIKTNV